MLDFNELDKKYKKIADRYNNVKNVSREELLNSFIKYNPDMTSTQISKDRDACIKVLKQDLRIENKISELISDCNKIEQLKKEINTKPTFYYPEFYEEPLPKAPQKKTNNQQLNIIAGYNYFKFPSFFKIVFSIIGFFALSTLIFIIGGFILNAAISQESSLHETVFKIKELKITGFDVIVFGVSLLIGGLIINKGSRAFLFTLIIPFKILFFIINKQIKNNKIAKENIKLETDYNLKKQGIMQRNQENYKKYCEKRNQELSEFENGWNNRLEKVSQMTEHLDNLLMLMRKEIEYLKDIYKNVQNKIFPGAEMIKRREKEEIINFLKNFRATTYSEAVNLLISKREKEKEKYDTEQFRLKQLLQQQLHDEAIRKIEEEKAKAQRKHNEEMMQLQKQQMQDEGQARLRAENIMKEQSELLEKQAEQVALLKKQAEHAEKDRDKQIDLQRERNKTLDDIERRLYDIDSNI